MIGALRKKPAEQLAGRGIIGNQRLGRTAHVRRLNPNEVERNN
jgi:hypothetical protein